MFSNQSPLNKSQSSLFEILKYLRTFLSSSKQNPAKSLHEIYIDSQQCTLAIKLINEKLTKFIESLSPKIHQKNAFVDLNESQKQDKSEEEQKKSKDKLLSAYIQQTQYYEQELCKLEQYLTKVGVSNFEGQLTNEIAVQKSKNIETTKEIYEKKLKIDLLISKHEKEQKENKSEKNEEIFKLRSFEEKIQKLEKKMEKRDHFSKHIEQENAKISQKINELKEKEDFGQIDCEIKIQEKGKMLKSQIEMMKKNKESAEEKNKRAVCCLELDGEKLNKENEELKQNLDQMNRFLSEQNQTISEYESKIGKGMLDIQEIIRCQRGMSFETRTRTMDLSINRSLVNQTNVKGSRLMQSGSKKMSEPKILNRNFKLKSMRNPLSQIQKIQA